MYQALVGVVLDGSVAGDGTQLSQTDQPIQITEGEYGHLPISVVYQSGSPVNLTNKTIVATVRESGLTVAVPPELLARFATTTDAAAGLALLEFLTADTIGYAGGWEYDLRLIDGSNSKEYEIIAICRFDIIQSLYRPDPPATTPGEDMVLVSLPTPSPSDVGKCVTVLDDSPVTLGFVNATGLGIRYTATGSEGTDIFVSLPAGLFADGNYAIGYSFASDTDPFPMVFPAGSDRTSSHFRVKFSVQPDASTLIDFTLQKL